MVSEQQIDDFHQDGAICLRQVFDANSVAALREAVETAIAEPGPYASDFSGGEGGRFLADTFLWTRHRAFRDIVVYSELGEIAGALIGSNSIRFFFDHLLVKEPGSTDPTPWHQDAPYFPIDGSDCCSIWIALDHVNRENGAVEYVKGSHKTGKLYAPESFYGDGRNRNDELEAVPDVDGDRDRYDILSWELEPGDCLVHHVRSLHGAPCNESDTNRRRGLATRWIGDDITYATRDGIPEPMTNSLQDLAPELVLGAPFDHPNFPVVWERPSAHSDA